MLIGYLLIALAVAVTATLLCLMTGGSLLMALAVYTLPESLMTATLGTAAAYKSRNAQR